MNPIFTLGLVGLLALEPCLSDEEAHKSEVVHKLAADFTSCPDGHKALRDVPIVWGHFELFSKSPKDYTDQERDLVDQMTNGEIIFGGDIIPNNHPEFRVVCQKCGYSYHPASLLEETRKILNVSADYGAYWSRSSNDASIFKIPFSERLRSFPTLEAVAGTIDYSQSVSSNGKILESESISFHTPRPMEEVLFALRAWLKANGQDPKGLKRVEEAFTFHTYDYDRDGVFLHVLDDDHFEAEKIHISLLLVPETAKKLDDNRD